MKKKLYQKFADFIVIQVRNASTIEMSRFWFNVGMQLDSRAINKHDWYLN